MSFGRKMSVFVGLAALSCVFVFALPDRSQPPLHVLVLFGQEGKLAVEVQQRGNAVWFDKNGDGQFESSERYASDKDIRDIELRDPDGITKYLIKSLSFWKEKESAPPRLNLSVHIQGSANYRQYCDTAMQPLNQPPDLAHFHGPLAIGPITINWELPSGLTLRTGDKPTKLAAFIGTIDATKKCWTVVEVDDHKNHWLLPEGIFPVVDIEFPAKNPGDPPIKRRYPLEGFC